MYSMLVCNYLISVFSLCQPSRLARPMPQHKQHQQEKVWKLPSRYKKVIHIKAKKRRPHIVVSFKVSKLFFALSRVFGFMYHYGAVVCLLSQAGETRLLLIWNVFLAFLFAILLFQCEVNGTILMSIIVGGSWFLFCLLWDFLQKPELDKIWIWIN